MPIELEHLDDGRGVLWQFRGTVTGQDMIDTNDTVFSEEPTDRLLYLLVDTSTADQIEVSVDEIAKIALQDKMAADKYHNLVIAAVASEQSIFGLARMWEARSEDARLHTQVFRTVPEAQAWLRSLISEDLTFE